MRRDIRACIFGLLAGFLILGYYSSLTMFYHVHIINGSIIAHSHPFDNNSDNPHSHTESECSIISVNNHTYWSNDLYTINIEKPDFIVTEFGFDYNSPEIITKSRSSLSLRAPPCQNSLT